MRFAAEGLPRNPQRAAEHGQASGRGFARRIRQIGQLAAGFGGTAQAASRICGYEFPEGFSRLAVPNGILARVSPRGKPGATLHSGLKGGAVTTRTSWPWAASQSAISPVVLPQPTSSGAKLRP